jgi:hypothetical protein
MGHRSKTTPLPESRNAVQQFIANHQDQISGVLSGFDRLVFRSTLARIARTDAAVSGGRAAAIAVSITL